MANPYPFGTLGERWIIKQATSKTRMDKARTKVDHVKWILDAMGVDGDTGALAGTYSNPLVIGTIRLWDNGGVLMVKAGSNPSSPTDGVAVGVGGLV